MSRRSTCRGTILVVALGILAILAILGATMVKVARVDNLTARSFKHSTDLNMAVDTALAWVEYRLVTDYWEKLDGKIYYTGSTQHTLTGAEIWTGGAYDNPHDPRVPIALITPSWTNGGISGTATVADRGFYLSSEINSGSPVYYASSMLTRKDGVYNLPITAMMPRPGAPISGQPFDSAWMKDNAGGTDKLAMYATGNRLIQVSVTVLDLAGRYNLNFHGDEVYDGTTSSGQSYLDSGVYLKDIAPNWTTSTAGGVRPPYALQDTWHASLQALSRYGSDNTPEYVDLQLNPLDSSRKSNVYKTTSQSATKPFYEDLPLTLEDEFELLFLYGTPAESRLERCFPYTFARDGSETSRDSKLYYRSLYTGHSWVSSARRRMSSESLGGFYVKADLNNGPKDDPTSTSTLLAFPIRAALFAAGVSASYPNKDLDQIVANVIDFRDDDCRPTAIDYGGYTVVGVDAQPYINEVFIDVQNQTMDTDSSGNPVRVIKVYVELVNPYDKVLPINESYTRLTYGPTQISIAGLPSSFPAGGPLSTEQKGDVLTFTIRVGQSETPAGIVSPIELFATARTGHAVSPKTFDVVIDRFTVAGEPKPGESWQRQCVRGKDRSGNSNIYFGGWDARKAELGETCFDNTSAPPGPLFAVNEAVAQAADKIARPVENRSLTPTNESQQARYKEEDMSFRRIGDIARVLRIGHPLATDSGGNPTTEKTVSEKLADKTDATTKDLYVDITDPKYAKITGYVMVNSPYYDRLDNDGDLVIDLEDSNTATQTADNLGPEIYIQGPINLKTAMPEVIRGMLPAQLMNNGARTLSLTPTEMFTMAKDICTYAQHSANNSVKPTDVKVKMPVDILNMTNTYKSKTVKQLFVGDGCDDDGNGAVDDWVEQTWLYGYMSNWATTRSDTFAVYGTVQMVADNGAGKLEGLRHFLAIIDRVPATAFPPYSSASNTTTPGRINEDYLGPRRVMMTWLD
jgi:hypothetical protein